MRKQRESLPSNYHMAIAEINQRFYPVQTQITEGDPAFSHIAAFSWWFEDQWSIPYAVGPRHTRGLVSFPTHAEAINFCHRSEEEWGVLFQCDHLVAKTDVYPERSAWYVDEIQRLTGCVPHVSWLLTEAHAFIWSATGTYHSVNAPSIYEAIVALYEDVYQQHTPPPSELSSMSKKALGYV